MEPLACRLRPKTFDDIVGQDHLVGKGGIVRKMCETGKMFSIILYGDPGIGKTSIAKIIASYYSLNVYEFNASIDNKAKLKDISEACNYFDQTIVIVDEIHRLKKDVQDFLLPFLEKGSLTLIGLTTVNPYQSINPAFRSRCHIYRLNPITKDDIKLLLNKVLKTDEFKEFNISDEIVDYITFASAGEIRTALNMLEAITLLGDKEEITIEEAQAICGKKALKLDEGSTNYYDCLSAFQKSIRGSDVDASLHYLARLCTLEDIDIIARRLMIIAYEDIGIANPQMGLRTLAACEVAKKVGFPEAEIPFSEIVVELALSPKSNSCLTAFMAAKSDFEAGKAGEIPPHILNREIGHNGVVYKFPHDFPDDWVDQEYMPAGLEYVRYYFGKETSSYERALKAHNEELKAKRNKK